MKYNCRVCGYGASERWIGRCPSCGRNYNIVAEKMREAGDKTSLATALDNIKRTEYLSTKIAEFDRVLGGGFVLGSTVLIGGPRGTGKSTVLLQAAYGFIQTTGEVVLYASGEERREAIEARAGRCGIQSGKLHVLGNQGDVEEVCDFADEVKAKLVIFDSAQTGFRESVDAAVGQVAQIDAVANWLTSFCLEKNVASAIVGHINKMGDFAGSEKLQHLVDTIVYCEPMPVVGEDGDPLPGTENWVEFRIDGKNRNGDKNASGLLEMTPEGLKTVSRKRSKVLELV